MSYRKVGCVVQGDIRRGSAEVLAEMGRHFDTVILSTWVGDKGRLPKGRYEVVLNEPPPVPGYFHRNYQRLSSAKGIEAAEALGCEYILKWRTDMLPTNLSVSKLLGFANYAVPPGVTARIVTCGFRTLSVEPDHFSSIPDLFSFSSTAMMAMLWGMEDLTLDENINIPCVLRSSGLLSGLTEDQVKSIYCAESELYLNFRERLRQFLQLSDLVHTDIVKTYFYLIDDADLGVCWFGRDQGFRSIKQAYHLPWWNERIWKHGRPTVVPMGYQGAGFRGSLLRKWTVVATKFNEKIQARWYKQYFDALQTNQGVP